MQFTSSVRKANVGDDPELVDREVAPALEVVTHCSLNGKLSLDKLTAVQIRLHHHASLLKIVNKTVSLFRGLGDKIAHLHS